MKIACIVYTKSGEEVAERIKRGIDADIFINRDYEGGIKTIFKDIFEGYDCIIFISATGIAVRVIASYIKDKTKDPAVVVVDDMGRYSISLLSGHIGGANEFAEKIASVIGAEPIITTASDGRGIESVDMFAKRYGLYIENMEDVKNITAIMVNGGSIRLLSEINININYKNISDTDYEGTILVTSKENVECEKPFCILRPKDLNVGIGCRRGKSRDEIMDAIEKVFRDNNLSLKSIKSVSSIDVKKDEKGIIEACEILGCPFNIFSGDEIKAIQDSFNRSDFVLSSVGVTSVCEPCAHLAGGSIIVNKTAIDGITVAIARED